MPVNQFYILRPTFFKTPVTVLNETELNLAGQRDNDNVFLRTKCDTKFKLGGVDYQWLYAFVLANKCIDLYVVWETSCNGIATEIYRGMFTFYDCRLNLDECVIEIKTKPEDQYTCVLERWKEEINMLLVTNQHTVKFNLPTNYEYVDMVDFGDWTTVWKISQVVENTVATSLTHEYSITAWPHWSYGKTIINTQSAIYAGAYNKHWRDFNATLTIVDIQVLEIGANATVYISYQLDARLFRQFTLVPPIGGVYEDLTTSGWFVDPDLPGGLILIAGITYKRYVKEPDGFSMTDYNDTSTGQTMIKNIGGVDYTVNLLGNRADYILNIDQKELERMHYLTDVIQELLTPCGLTLSSQILNNAIDPMDGVSQNDLSKLMIAQKSDCRFEPGTFLIDVSPATKGFVSLELIMSWLKDILNLQWDIVGTDFIIEHKKYWENGGTYAGAPVVQLDTTVIDNVIFANAFETSTDKYVGKEVLKYSEWDVWDFLGYPIEYDACHVDRSTSNERILNDLCADVYMLYFHSENVAKSGFVLIAARDIAGELWVITEPSVVGGQDVLNNTLTVTNAMDKYWRNGRVLPQGTLNGVLVTFDSHINISTQDELSIPECCPSLNSFGRVKTQLGIGELDGWKYKDGVLTLTLLFTI
jgi:hypothetical protein